MKIAKIINFLLLITLIIGSYSCKKVKNDANLPNFSSLKSANSSIRIIALTAPTSTTALIKGFKFNLTPNFVTSPSLAIANPNDLTGQSNSPLFKNSSPFSIPSKLLDQGGEATIKFFYKGVIGEQDITVKDDPNNPTDYYIIHDSTTSIGFRIYSTSRSVIAPSNPQNFKIRVINQSSPTDIFGLTGFLSLTDAFGKSIGETTSHIPLNVASSYIELPYGAYNFKIFNDGGMEIPPNFPSFLDSGFSISSNNSLNSIFSFQPGGVYSIMVNSNPVFTFNSSYLKDINDPSLPLLITTSLNSYSIITEVNPSSNASFARIDMVNTLNGQGLNLKIDGLAVFNSLGYLKPSSRYILTAGSHHFSVTNNEGMTLAEQDQTIFPFDYITLWVYQNQGKTEFVFCANDMSNPQSGQKVRFLNLSNDIPYVSFTNNGSFFKEYNSLTRGYFIPDYADTTSSAQASQNLPQGKAISHLPYIILDSIRDPNYKIFPFQSFLGPPLVSPGNLLPAGGSVVANNFIADPTQYQSITFPKYGESGVYTVALIGAALGNSPAQPARLFILNHTN